MGLSLVENQDRETVEIASLSKGDRLRNRQLFELISEELRISLDLIGSERMERELIPGSLREILRKGHVKLSSVAMQAIQRTEQLLSETR
jgi:uncharacterized protein